MKAFIFVILFSVVGNFSLAQLGTATRKLNDSFNNAGLHRVNPPVAPAPKTPPPPPAPPPVPPAPKVKSAPAGQNLDNLNTNSSSVWGNAQKAKDAKALQQARTIETSIPTVSARNLNTSTALSSGTVSPNANAVAGSKASLDKLKRINTANLTSGARDRVRGKIAAAENSVKKATAADQKAAEEITTSRTARREVMRQQGIPTSQQPVSQSQNAAGREYTYKVSKPRGKVEEKSVQQQTLDRNHDNPHWEAGTVKKDDVTDKTRMNKYGRPKIKNDKAKAEYDG